MRNTVKSHKLSADNIAEKAIAGEDISFYFTNTGKMYPPTHISLDLETEMIHEIDTLATEKNVDREAVIKMFLRQSLDQHYLKRKSRNSANQYA